MRKKTAKTRAYLSSQRKELWQKLEAMLQRERDMLVESALGAPEAAQKTAFCGQEIAKLREQVRNLEKGVSRQRAWARGKQLH
jgi:hypothetical protein